MITKTASEVAASLDGAGYPLRLCREDQELLSANGLVVVIGNSDDIISFYGAIDDESGVYNGGNVLLDKDGLLESEEQFFEGRPSAAQATQYHERIQAAKKIKAKWCEGGLIPWTYETDIKHETFKIMDEGSVYCVGLVFHVDDLNGLSDFDAKQAGFKKRLAEHMREAEAIAYEYFKNCEVGPEREKAALVYENIRTALRVG